MRSTNRVLVFLVFFLLMCTTVVSAEEDKSNAVQTETIIDSDDYETDYLTTSADVVVKIWIDDIQGINGSDAHPIDLYIVNFDQSIDHGCYGDNNMFAEDFTPLQAHEGISAGTYIEWTPPTEDSFRIIIDNCDNQRTTDYNSNIDSIIITYSVDDYSDELAAEIADAAAGILGGLGVITLVGAFFCCGVPFLIIVVLLMRKNKVVVQQTAPSYVAPAPMPVFGQSPTMAAPPIQPVVSHPSAVMNGYSDGAGYEWLDFEGSKYWRSENSNSEWTKHS
jgi:hypothetical protein